MNKSHARTLALYSLLLATALVLSYFESLLLPNPLPLPGVKAGLANTVTLFSLYTLSPLAALAILLLRILLSSLFGGGITTFLFSVTGGILSFVAMLLLKKFKAFSIYGISILGAAVHCIGQILAATVLFRSVSIFSYLPIMLIASVFTGALIAFVTQLIINRTKLYKK